MDDQPPNYHRQFLASPQHAALGLLTLGVGFMSGLILPLIAGGLLAATGNLCAGLVYPIVVALITVVVGGLYIRESRHVRIWDEVGGETPELQQVAGEVAEGAPATAD